MLVSMKLHTNSKCPSSFIFQSPRPFPFDQENAFRKPPFLLKNYIQSRPRHVSLGGFFLPPMRGRHRRLSTTDEKYEESFSKQFQHWEVNS